MKFLAPYAFWFAATIPVVVLFYLLKRKRVVKLVSSTLLWQKFLAETQANAPFQKLRHNWLLILQILLLLLAIFALSRPYFAGDAANAALRVLILDASASMQSTDVAPSRFEKARGEALKWVDSLKDHDQMIVLQAAANTEVKQSATSEKAALRRAIESTAATDSPTRLKEALKLAETLTKDRSDAEIHLFSDGAVGDLSEFENKGLNIVYHRIGERANNLGIITLDAKANPEDPGQRAIYTSVQNFSDGEQTTTLELRFDGQVVEVRNLKLAPGATSPQVFVATQSRNGIFSVHLGAQDDLASDNQASVVSRLPQPIKILLVTRGNRFLERALRGSANAQVAVTQDSTDAAEGFDLVVLDDTLPTVWPAGNVLAIHVANTNWFEGISRVENPAVVDWKNTHALLRYVNFDNVHISESLAVKTPSWAISLADAQQSPLILSGELGKQKIVWVGFDTLQSTWPLRISFPIFIANAVDWLNPASARNNQLFVRAGEPFRLALLESAASAEITLPNGTKRTLQLDEKARELVFGETTRQGIYRLKVGTNETDFCVNLLDAAESNIKPQSELQFGKYVQGEATTIKRANMEMWRWIAVAALAVLMFEWWYYHRRTA
ncbi:MAG: BatA domain-containing protein [Verrucomicrobia bacterium]|nr:BatA domain-containing protein [Verrucomicrobiota bacterium]